MTLVMRSRRLGLAVALVLLPTLAMAAERAKKPPKPGQFNADHKTVEMFEAIEEGTIAVKVIPKDSTQCRVMIENKSDKPLNVKLPAAFAGVPVLAQLGGGRRGGGGGFGGNSGGRNQSMGGGMMGGRGGMGGGGFMNVAPEKVGKLKVATVCLEHGKKDPRAAIPYEIRPLKSFTEKPGVAELLEMLASGRVNQRAAQVAAWHLNNEMSFQELAAKRIKHANGTAEPYFSPQELQAGMQLTAMAHKLAEKRKKSPGETTVSLK